jgi:hypothetical protein
MLSQLKHTHNGGFYSLPPGSKSTHQRNRAYATQRPQQAVCQEMRPAQGDEERERIHGMGLSADKVVTSSPSSGTQPAAMGFQPRRTTTWSSE